MYLNSNIFSSLPLPGPLLLSDPICQKTKRAAEHLTKHQGLTCQTVMDHSNVKEKGHSWKDMSSGMLLHGTVKDVKYQPCLL